MLSIVVVAVGYYFRRTRMFKRLWRSRRLNTSDQDFNSEIDPNYKLLRDVNDSKVYQPTKLGQWTENANCDA